MRKGWRLTFGKLVDLFLTFWGEGKWKHLAQKSGKKESGLLNLCCDKALDYLGWHPTLSFQETEKLTAEWYKNYYHNNVGVYDFSCLQIDYYLKQAKEKNAIWIK